MVLLKFASPANHNFPFLGVSGHIAYFGGLILQWNITEYITAAVPLRAA